MPNLLTTRRFTVNDGVGDTTVYPVNSGLKYRWQLEEGGRFYRKRLQTKLLFRGEDYTFFKALFDAGDCALITILIEVYCGGDWREEFTGKIVIGQGSYHYDRCEAEYEIQPYDAYDCFKRVLKNPLNWLSPSYAGGATLLPVYGSIETVVSTYSGNEFGSPEDTIMFLKDIWSGGTQDTTSSNAPDGATAWRPVDHLQTHTPDVNPQLEISTTWGRETVNYPGGPPPGGGWINTTGNTWVRPLLYNNTYELNYFGLEPAIYQFIATYSEEEIDNGRHLPDLLPEIIEALECASVTDVYSDFFGINPPADSPTNAAYDLAEDYFQSLLIFQKSDIVNADATNNATLLQMNINDFLTALTGVFNCYWSLEPIGGGDYVLRIEHWTFYEAANGIDLTADHPLSVVGNNSFSSETKVPNAEIFRYQESFNAAFLEAQIQYPSACSDSDDNIEYVQGNCCADIGGLLNNSNATLTGFVLVSTVDLGGGDYLVDNTNDVMNGVMGWDVLHENLWIFGRYHMEATSTASGAFTVESTRRFREQQRIVFKYCCEETDFDPVQLIQSGLGWGQIKDIEHDTEKDQMSVILLH